MFNYGFKPKLVPGVTLVAFHQDIPGTFLHFRWITQDLNGGNLVVQATGNEFTVPRDPALVGKWLNVELVYLDDSGAETTESLSENLTGPIQAR